MFFKNKNQKEGVKMERPYLAGNFLKAGVFALLSLVVIGGNFFAEGYLNGEVDGEQPDLVEFDYTVDNFVPQNGVMRFAEGEANSVSIRPDESAEEYIFDLQAGKIWSNFTISDAKVNLVAGRVVIIPDRAAFDLKFDGEQLNLAVYNGDVYLGFLQEGVNVDAYTDQYGTIFTNTLLVPRDSQVQVSMNKVDERIELLLYSKLVKEFKYSAIASADRGSDWVKTNQLEDEKFMEGVRADLRSAALHKGKTVDEDFLGGFIFWAEENLTFVPQKNREIIYGHLFSFLDDANFYAIEGDKENYSLSWDNFEIELAALPTEISQSEEYYGRFDKYLYDLSIFGPTDEQHDLYLELLDKKFEQKRDSFMIVHQAWSEVYEGMDVGETVAEDAVNTYYKYFVATLGTSTDPIFYEKYLTYNNQLLDNLLLRSPTFYKDAYFAIKNALEQEFLALITDEDLKKELQQDFVNNKITFLKRLRTFFFDGDVKTEEAKEIFARLIEEIDGLMSEADSGQAVVELFETELENVGDFWGYLNSPEYHTSLGYGANQEERYESYLQEKDRIWSIIDVQEDVLGEDEVEMTKGEVVAEVRDFFEANGNVSQLKIGEFTDVNQRFIPIEVVLGGYPFEAQYDRDQNTVKEVYTYGELISDRAIKLDSLLQILKSKFADFVPPEDMTDDEINEETFAERAARLYVAERVAEFGFDVDIERVSVVDELTATYRVSDVYLPGQEDIVATFDFVMNGERVRNLFLRVDGDPVVMDGEMTLEELKAILEAESDFDTDQAGGTSSEPEKVRR